MDSYLITERVALYTMSPCTLTNGDTAGRQ